MMFHLNKLNIRLFLNLKHLTGCRPASLNIAKASFSSTSNDDVSSSEKISTHSRKKYNKPPPIPLTSVRTNQQVDENEDGENSKNSHFRRNALMIATLPLLAFCLGFWQIERRKQKLELIKFLDERTKSPPIELPTNPEQLENFASEHEYQPVKVKGYFIHSKEILLTIKSDLTGKYNIPGGHVITPFLVKGRKDGLIILVNRGFVPYTHYSPTTRLEGQVDGEVELIGLLRSDEVKNTFTPENRPPNEWHHRNIQEIAKTLGTAPIFLDANLESTVKNGPVGGQTAINIRNEHLSYIITWFSLGILTSIMWWKRYSKAFI